VFSISSAILHGKQQNVAVGAIPSHLRDFRPEDRVSWMGSLLFSSVFRINSRIIRETEASCYIGIKNQPAAILAPPAIG
jgi:hypothetical protein